MDFILCFLAFVAGALFFYLIFGGAKPGPFEKSLMQNLAAGKRVIVSIDDECYIFEMFENRLRITRGVSTFIDEPLTENED